MKDTIELILELRKKTENYAEKVAIELKIKSHELPAEIFNKIFNSLTLSTEILDFYYYSLSKKNISPIQEDHERIIHLLNMTFVYMYVSCGIFFQTISSQFPRKNRML